MDQKRLFFRNKIAFIYVLFLLVGMTKISAQPILVENYDYISGTALTANGWSAQTAGAGTNPVSVINGSLSYTGYSASGIGNMVSISSSGEDVYKSFTPTVNSGTLYVAGIFNFSLATTTGDYFFHLIGNTSPIFFGRLFIKKDANNKLAFGLMKNSGGTTFYTTFDYDLNVNYLVVMKYTFNTSTTNDDVAEIFINPANLSSEPAASTFSQSANTDATFLSGVAIRQGGASSAPSVKIDGIRIATTWNDVIGSAAVAPNWTATWPKAENATNSGFSAKVNLDIAGNAYYVVLPSGANAPTAAQVKAGQDANGNALAANLKGTIVCNNGNTEYSSNVSGLSPATTYNIYFIAENISGTILQINPVMLSITTISGFVAPTVSNPTVSSIGYNFATLGGDITSDGGDPITARGTVWNTSAGVSISDNNLLEGNTTIGVFTHQRTSLPSKAQIFYKAFATNSAGTTLSTEASFFTLAEEPVAHVANFAAVASSPTQIDLSWTPVFADGYLVIRRQGAIAPTGMPIDASAYNIGTLIGNGTVVADILNGTTSSVQISALSPMTQYSFIIIPYAYDGLNYQTYNYNINPVIPTVSATTLTPPATIYTWNVTTGIGDYNVATNWTPARTTPASNDILLINNGLVDTIFGLTTQTIGQLEITGNSTVCLQAASTATLSISGYTNTDLSILSGSQLKVIGANALTVKLLATATAIINGSINYSGAAHKLDAVDAGAIVFENGSSLTQDIGCTGNIFTNTGTANAILFKNGSVITQLTGSNPFGLSAPNSKVVFEDGSTFKFRMASGQPSLSGRTYSNLEIDPIATNTGLGAMTGSGTLTLSNLSIDSSNVSINLTGLINIKGNITVSPTTILNFNPSSTGGSMNLIGIIPQTLSGGGIIKMGSKTNLIINNINGININDSIILGGVLTFTSGIINLGANITLDSTSSIAGTPSSTSMIISNSFKIYKVFNPTNLINNFIFPIGETTKYMPVSIALNTATYDNQNFISVKMNSIKNPLDLSSSNYLKRYWDIESYGITAFSCNAVFQYDIADVIGSENLILCKNFTSNPISVFDPANVTLHQLSAIGISEFGSFGGGEDLSSKTLNLTLLLEGLFNGIDMTPAQDENGNHFGANIADLITVELRENTSPYNVASTFTNQYLLTNGNCVIDIPASYADNYYIVVKHRNSIETWSNNPISFAINSINYNFTDAASKAFGNNMNQVANGVYAIYVGDVNQDGLVDGSDMSDTETSNNNFETGYLVTDVNGDGLVDGSDMSIVETSNNNFVSSIIP